MTTTLKLYVKEGVFMASKEELKETEITATNIQETEHDVALKEILDKIYEKIGTQAKEKIEEEKKNADVYLFMNDDENIFFFKGLRTREYKQLKKNASSDEELEVALIKTSVIYPELTDEMIDNMYAGLYESLSKFTLAASAFNDNAPVIKV